MIFITRIMRTGGTSFWRGIRNNFIEGECWQKEPYERTKYKEIGGIVHALQKGLQFGVCPNPKVFMHHLPYGVHKLFKTYEPKYVTFLREPIARTISLLQYARNLKYEKEYDAALDKQEYYEKQLFLQGYFRNERSAKDVLLRCLEHETCCNIMTKQLSGLEDFDNFASNYSWRSGNLYCVNHTNKKKYSYYDMKEFLLAAKKNLETYAFIGFQERGTAEHKRVCKMFDWEYTDYGRLNQSVSLPVWKELNLEAYLTAMNEYDIQLYDYAKLLRRKADASISV